METNEKLKKIGNFFQKGLRTTAKAVILGTAFMATNIACKQPTTQGNTTEQTQPEQPTPEVPEEQTPEPTPENPIPHEHVWSDWTTVIAATETTVGKEERHCTVQNCDAKETREIAKLQPTEKYPLTDMNLPKTGAYERHNFVNENDSIINLPEAERLAWGEKRYAQARDFMAGKLNEFKDICENPASANYDAKASSYFNNYDEFTNNDYIFGCGYLDGVVNGEHTGYSKFMGRICYDLNKIDARLNDEAGKYSDKFMACYQRLDEQATNDSMGAQKSTVLSSSSDACINMRKYFGNEVDTTPENAAVLLDQLLDILVANNDNAPQKQSLQKAINLPLYAAGKIGAHNLASDYIGTDPTRVSGTCTMPSFKSFRSKITTEVLNMFSSRSAQMNSQMER